MENENIWLGTQTPLYNVGEYVVYNGIVLKCEGCKYTNKISPYDASTIYSPGDYCSWEGKLYMYVGKAEATPDGPFNPENWTEPPIYAVRQ